MRRLFLGLVTLIVGLTSFLLAAGWRAFGQAPTDDRLRSMQASPQWQGDRFVNPMPLYNPFFENPERWLESSDYASPDDASFAHTTDPAVYAETSPLRITWFGHSTLLIELGGVRFLADPVFSTRVSPYQWLGPERWYPPPLPIDDLPPIDAVLISHDHYDHLDMETIEAIAHRVGQFIVPLGVGAHLEYWGVSTGKIIELDWWDESDVAGVRVTATPARHASGRVLIDNDRTLWMGFALRDADNAVFFSGDTGLFPEFKDIGDRLGPFDVTMIEVGAYGIDWPDWHIGPEQAVLAHDWVRGGVLLPVHWGLFNLARHAWTEPIERALLAAADDGVPVVVPRPGVPIDFDKPLPEQERWWPKVPWVGRDERPIVATGDFDRSRRPRLRP